MKKYIAAMLLLMSIAQTARAGWWCDAQCEALGAAVFTVCAAAVATSGIAGEDINGTTLDDCVDLAAVEIADCWAGCE